MTVLAWCLLVGCLFFACITDCISRRVYNFTWWIGAVAAGWLLWRRLWEGRLPGELLADLSLFFLLQLSLFCRMYGRADCYAFCVCAMAEASLGMGLSGYLVHMLLSVVFLLPIQLLKGNIGSSGNLKKPVAFLPYIAAAFWSQLALCRLCPEIRGFAAHIYAVFS